MKRVAKMAFALLGVSLIVLSATAAFAQTSVVEIRNGVVLAVQGNNVVVRGPEGIREFLDEYDQGHRAEECVELESLEQWRDEILSAEQRAAENRPKSKLEILRRRLEAAIAAEEFEEAARFRDQIRKLKTKD